MKAPEIEKLNQLISKVDMSGNEKVKWLINFIDNQLTEQLATNEPKEKLEKLKRITIGYKFKNESAHNKFLLLLNILSDIVFVDKYINKGFYLKGFDINNKDYNLLFKFAKKYNLLDELFAPVYKKEKKNEYKQALDIAIVEIDNVKTLLNNIDKTLTGIRKKKIQIIELQYFNGTEWIKVGTWGNEEIAWSTLGGNDYNYRTIDEDGKVITDKSGEFYKT